MGTPFKDGISRASLAPVAAAFAATIPTFSARAFLDDAAGPLDRLELKARVNHVADRLRAHLAPDWPAAVAQLLRALPPPHAGTTGLDAAFAWWPVVSVVERHGVHDAATSVPALRVLTQRFSAEFAIRPFLAADPAATLARLSPWTRDPSPHVRRLVSEGTRPRLPWGAVLRAFVADPSPVVPLLDALVADPSLYVRRSVANHLGDIAKDHPALAVVTAERWLAAHPTDQTRWIVRHGLRHPVKLGDPAALSVLGYAAPRVMGAKLAVSPRPFTLGGKLTASASFTSSAHQRLALDLVLGLRRKNGGLGRKVFKWTTVEVSEGERWVGEKALPLRPVSTRRHYPGRHTLTLQVNGVELDAADFELRLPEPQ